MYIYPSFDVLILHHIKVKTKCLVQQKYIQAENLMSRWIAWSSINNDWNTWHNTTGTAQTDGQFYFETNIIDVKKVQIDDQQHNQYGKVAVFNGLRNTGSLCFVVCQCLLIDNQC